jgi:hypothetical protein
VRLLVAAVTGVVLVDTEHDLAAGDSAIPVPISSKGLSSLAHDPDRPVVPLRVVITTPVYQAGSSEPQQPARLYATSALFAVPASLASELLSLHASMEADGRAQGLEDAEVWAGHWQPLMEDMIACICAQPGSASDAAGGRPSATSLTAGTPPNMDTLTPVLHSLLTFFSTHAMHAWLDHLQWLLFSQQGHGQHHDIEQMLAAARATNDSSDYTMSSISNACTPPTPHSQHPCSMIRGFGRPSIEEPCTHESSEHSTDAAACSFSSAVGPNKGATAMGGATTQMPPPPLLQNTSLPPVPAAAVNTTATSSPGSAKPLHLPAAPAPKLSVLAQARSLGLGGCLHLLVSGFPDAQQESEWQKDTSVTSARMTDPMGIGLQACIFMGNAARMWGAGMLGCWQDAINIALFISTAAVWIYVFVR